MPHANPIREEPGTPTPSARPSTSPAGRPADEWHWHGAAPEHFMSHLSITEAAPGDERPEADWGEHVTDDEYNARRRGHARVE
jgi:hypothetical protein